MFNKFFLKVVVACTFWAARIITCRKSFDFNWPEVRLKEKIYSISRVPYNKQLTNLTCSSRTGEYWPLVVLYGPRDARSVLSWPRANISQYGSRARLVKPWPNGLASRRKLKTWGYLRLRLVRACVYLRLLAMTCIALTFVEIRFARKSKQVFHRLATQPKSTQVEWRPWTYY